MVTKTQTKRQDEQTTYINPKTDFGFKKIFSTGRHAQARLLHLLKAFLPELMENVVSVAFQPTEVLGETESEKRVSLDLYCATNTGDLIIIEMQRAPQTFFNSRVITYVCRVISSEVERGDMEYKIPAVICFCIMDFTPPLLNDESDFFHVFRILSKKGKLFSEKISFCLLDLSKFAAPNPGQIKDIQFSDDQHKWAYILSNLWHMEEQDLTNEEEVFLNLFRDCMYSKLTKMEKEEYKKSVLEYYDVQDAMRCVREEGREEGLQQGEANARYFIARSMLSKDFDPALVADIVGLAEAEVLALVKE
jgi:predicted transposase/invertase (TIGR01784 family)